MGAYFKSGRILSLHQPSVKRFGLFLFLNPLAQQGKQLYFFTVKQNGRTFHFKVGNQNGCQDGLVKRNEITPLVCDHD